MKCEINQLNMCNLPHCSCLFHYSFCITFVGIKYLTWLSFFTWQWPKPSFLKALRHSYYWIGLLWFLIHIKYRHDCRKDYCIPDTSFLLLWCTSSSSPGCSGSVILANIVTPLRLLTQEARGIQSGQVTVSSSTSVKSLCLQVESLFLETLWPSKQQGLVFGTRR